MSMQIVMIHRRFVIYEIIFSTFFSLRILRRCILKELFEYSHENKILYTQGTL